MEIDARLILQDRANGVPDEDIFETLLRDSGGSLTVDDFTMDLNAAKQSGDSVSSIMDFITSGKALRTKDNVDAGIASSSIDSQPEALLSGAATGVTNLMGLPVDLVNMGLQAGEGLVRKGINTVGGDVSTNPDDFYLSSSNPIGGGQNVRDTIEAASLGTVDYVDSREEVPQEYRPAFQAGRVIGENALPIAGGLQAAKAGFGLTNPLMQGIRNNPAKFAATEAAATTGAAAGVAAVEAGGLGDNPWVMMGAELLGGISGANVGAISKASPLGMAYRQGRKAVDQVFSSWSDTGARKLAVDQILKTAEQTRKGLLEEADFVESNGNTTSATALREQAEFYTPERIISDIETADSLGGTLAAGDLTGNPLLMAMQKRLMVESPEFGKDVMERANLVLSGILKASDVMARAGNTEMAKALRTNFYSSVIDSKLKLEEDKAAEALKAMKGDPNAASILTQKTIFKAKDNIRSMETALWDRINQEQSVSGEQLSAVIQKLKDGLPEGRTIAGGGQLDDVIDNLQAEIRKNGSVTVGRILQFRSEMLDQSRSSAANSEFKKAGLFDDLAAASIDQLSTLDGAAGSVIDQARGFSAALNKRFTRYFVKDVLATETKGGTSIRDTAVLREGFGSGGAEADEKFRELREAAEFTDAAADRVELIRMEDSLAAKKAAAENVEEPVPPTTDAATTDDVIYPENTAYPYRATAAAQRPVRDEFGQVQFDENGEMITEPVGDPSFREPGSGNDIFPPDGRRSTFERQFQDEVTDAVPPEAVGDGDPVPRDELPNFESTQERLDKMFNRPEGETYSADPKPEDAPKDGPTVDWSRTGATPDYLPPALADEPVLLGLTISKAQEDFLRSKIMEFEDVTTGVLDLKALDKFINQNQNLVNQFDSFKEDLLTLYEANKTAARLIDELGFVRNTERLSDAIGKTLATDTPVEGYSRLAREAVEAGSIAPEAKIDFRNATIDEIFAGAGDPPDFTTVAKRMLQPMSRRSGDPTILDVMVDTGILSADEKNAIGEMIFQGLQLEKRMTDPKTFNQVMSDTPDLQKNLARLIGANVGVLFGRGDASLQAAAIGSAFFKKYIDQLPIANQKNQMEKLFKVPELIVAGIKGRGPMQKTVIETIKEYTRMARQLGVGGAVKIAGRKVGDNLETMSLAYPSAVTGNTEDESVPTISIDEQMMDLGMQ